MSKDNFLQKIFRLFRAGKSSLPPKSAPPHDSAMLSNLLQMVGSTDEVELGCDEVFDLLDEYAEAEARGEDVAGLLPLVNRHFDRCRDCLEEYGALLRMIEATTRIDRQGS
jgi:hypothetical protein